MLRKHICVNENKFHYHYVDDNLRSVSVCGVVAHIGHRNLQYDTHFPLRKGTFLYRNPLSSTEKNHLAVREFTS